MKEIIKRLDRIEHKLDKTIELINQLIPNLKTKVTKTPSEKRDLKVILDLFNKTFNKKTRMTAQARKYISARLNDGFTEEQIKRWFEYVRDDKWWQSKPVLYRISTLLNETLGDKLDAMGAARPFEDKPMTEEQWEM